MLLQGDQGLAKTRDIVRLGHLLRRQVEVHDAQQEEEEESQEDKFGLEREGLDVFEVSDLLLTAELPCRENT